MFRKPVCEVSRDAQVENLPGVEVEVAVQTLSGPKRGARPEQLAKPLEHVCALVGAIRVDHHRRESHATMMAAGRVRGVLATRNGQLLSIRTGVNWI